MIPVVVIAEAPLSIAPNPEVIEPEFNAPVVTMLPPPTGQGAKRAGPAHMLSHLRTTADTASHAGEESGR